jgi:hypothetical protein
MPFLEGPRPLAGRAVKAAGLALIGAKWRALIGEADGLGEGLDRKGGLTRISEQISYGFRV